MYDAPFVAMAEQPQELPHDGGDCCFCEVLLPLEDSSKGLTLPILDDYEEAMIIFEKLVYLRNCEMINFFEFIDLILKHSSLSTSDFVLVYYVDCSGEGRLQVNRLPELIKLILFETRRQQLILIFDASFDLFDKVGLLELDLVFLAHNLCRAFFLRTGIGGVAHYKRYSQMKFDNSIVKLNIISISIMKKQVIIIIVILSLLCLPVIGQGCAVCSRCKGCSADVLGDQYLDSIDGLLQKKIEQLGYPEQINRTAGSRNITYSIQYSSGLTIQLALSLDNMQIQLLNYTFNQPSTTLSQSTTQVTSTNSQQRTSDGYLIITDLTSNMQIAQITRFLSKIVQASMANFKLTAAEYTLSPATIYRLYYQILTFSSPLIQAVYIQSLGNGAYQLLDSNYSQLQPPALKTINPLAILNDVWLPRINSLIINQYSNFLGQRPSILSISQQEPYYQFRYQVADNNYTFFVMYDFIQNRIIHGNITITRRGEVAAGQTSTGTTSTSASSSTTTTTSSQSGPSSSNVRSASTGPASFLPSSQTVTTSSSTSQTFSSTYSDLPNTQSNQQVSLVVSYLKTLNIQFSSSDIRSIKVKQLGSTIYYQLIIQLSRMPTTRIIFYQIEVTVDSNNKISLSEANYASLDNPQFAILTLEEVTADTYIRQIAQFLLNKQHASLTADSRVVQIERDFPYYRFTFVNNQQTYVSIVALFNVYTQNIQVMSTNTQQRSISSSNTPRAPTSITTPTTMQTTTTTTTTSSNRQTSTSSSQTTGTISSNNGSGTQNNQINTNSNSPALIQVPRANSSTSSSQVTQNSQQINLVRVPQSNNQQNQPTEQTNSLSSQTAQTSTQATSGLVAARQVTNSQPTEALIPAARVIPQATTQNSQQTTTAATANLVRTTQITNSEPNSSQGPSSSQSIISSSTAQSASSTVQSPPPQSVPSSNQPLSSNAQTSSSSSSSGSSSSPSEEGFLRMSSESNSYFPYVVAGMRKVNGTFIEKGISTGDIKYTDILYKVQQNILTVILKAEVQGKQYVYQYQGQINQSGENLSQTSSSSTQINSNNQGQSSNLAQQGSSNQQNSTLTTQSSTSTNQPRPASNSQSSSSTSSISSSSSSSSSSSTLTSSSSGQNSVSTQSSSTSSQVSSNSVSYEGAVYNRIPAQMAEQAYITLYLRYLTTTGLIYAMENLSGIFTNPMVPYSLLFRYHFNAQFYHILTTPTEIQQTLVRYYNQQNQKNNQPSTSPSTNQNNTQASSRNSNQPTQPTVSTQQNQTSSQTAQASSVSQAQNIQSAQPTQPRPTQPTQQTQQTQPTQPIQQVSLVTISNSNQNSRPQQASATSNPQQTQAQVLQQPTTHTIQNQNTQSTQSQQASLSRQQSTTTSSSSSIRNSMVSIDPNCLCYDGARCMRCAHRYYLKNNQCISIPLECLSYDLITGACYSCVPGYALAQGLCEPEAPVAYYFNNTCVSCFGNYKMVNRRCIYSPSYNPSSPNYIRQKNILCFAWQSNNCVQCIPGAYLSSRGVCELVDPFCSIFDYVQEACNTCEDGYSIRNGRCFKKQ